ncbi:MAG: glycosyltransferase family 4 protein [Rhodocyclaceae bacterium]
MKLAVFKDHGIGRFFAQLFDDIPETTFFISEKNKSGMNVTRQAKYILSEKEQARHILKAPLKAWQRLRENDFDRKRDFHYFELAAAVANDEFDIALTGSEHSLYTLASLKAKGARFKLVYWVPFTIPFVDLFAERSLLIREFAFPHVDHFVAITQTCAQTLALEGIAAERITHVYPGIDLQAFQPAVLPPRDAGDFHVLFVGKLTSWKGCYTLLYAAKLLLPQIPGLRITLVGRGAQRAGLEKAAALLGIAERIAFTGFVDYEAMPSFYGQADVFILPAMPAINLAEQFGYVVAEAMACGLPAVVSRVGGLPEVVGENADLIFTPGDYRELAARLLKLHDDPQLRRTLASYCLDLARQRYGAQANGQQLHTCLQEVMKK